MLNSEDERALFSGVYSMVIWCEHNHNLFINVSTVCVLHLKLQDFFY